MSTQTSESNDARGGISDPQKSEIEDENINTYKPVNNRQFRRNRKRSVLVNVGYFIKKMKGTFKHTSTTENRLGTKSNVHDLSNLYGDMDENKNSNMSPSVGLLDVGKIIDFDTSQEDLVDIDALFDNLISKIDDSVNLSQTSNPDSRSDNLFDAPDSDGCGNTWKTVNSANSDMVQLNDNRITNSSEQKVDFDQKLVSDIKGSSKLITVVTPPPRSNKRPVITDNQNAKEFYHGKSNLKDVSDKLSLDFEHVAQLDDNHKNCSNSNDRVNSLANYLNKKSVNFSSNVSLPKTYAGNEYDQSDPCVAYTLEELKNPEYIQSLKSEINEFKKTEMTVHEDSKSSTHYV